MQDVNVKVPESIGAALDRYAGERGVKRAEAARELLTAALASVEVLRRPELQSLIVAGVPLETDPAGVLQLVELGAKVLTRRRDDATPFVWVTPANEEGIGLQWPPVRSAGGVSVSVYDEQRKLVAAGVVRSDGYVAPSLEAVAPQFENLHRVMAEALTSEPAMRAARSPTDRTRRINLVRRRVAA